MLFFLVVGSRPFSRARPERRRRVVRRKKGGRAVACNTEDFTHPNRTSARVIIIINTRDRASASSRHARTSRKTPETITRDRTTSSSLSLFRQTRTNGWSTAVEAVGAGSSGAAGAVGAAVAVAGEALALRAQREEARRSRRPPDSTRLRRRRRRPCEAAARLAAAAGAVGPPFAAGDAAAAGTTTTHPRAAAPSSPRTAALTAGRSRCRTRSALPPPRCSP